MSSEILSFLNELTPKETENFFNNIKNNKFKITYKLTDISKVENTQILSTPFGNKFVVTVSNRFQTSAAEATFKVVIGTEIFFFKTVIKTEKKSYIIQGPFIVFKLMRRKNTRYIIPENWAQSGFIVSAEKKMLNSKIRLVDMSLSGIRIHTLTELPRYERKQKITLQFKLHRRGVVVVEAVIQHVKYNHKSGQLIGVQFVQETPLIHSKIANLCDDLIHASV